MLVYQRVNKTPPDVFEIHLRLFQTLQVLPAAVPPAAALPLAVLRAYVGGKNSPFRSV
jgi:hypothetical protein